jgi:rod shape determining protein RodA
MTWQPAELAKLAVVIGMALVLAERGGGGWRGAGSPRVVLTMLAVIAIPAGLILAQPDMGTLLVLGGAAFGALAVAGVARWWLFGVVAGGAAAVTAAVAGGLLKQYQINRFLAFTDPSLDPRGAGYNVDQARIAIGNGGLFGQGLFNGSQTRAGFVPEQQTDFIFTVAGEELGLLGALTIVALIGVVLWRILAIAARADDAFGRIAAAGIACWFGLQSFWNIGMCLGIMPVTGIPLPFVSYGGSSMLACLAAVGIVQSIHLRTQGSPSGRLQRTGVLLRVG